MRYSKGRIRQLSKQMIEKLNRENTVVFLTNENNIKNMFINVLENYFNSEEEVCQIVVNKINNRKKRIVPGSNEWDLLFRKLYEEEMGKRLINE